MEDDPTIDPIKMAEFKAMLKAAAKEAKDLRDFARDISKAQSKTTEDTSEEVALLKEINDLSASISAKKARMTDAQREVNVLQGAYISLQRQIVEGQVKLENSVYKSNILKDTIRDQNILLAQKQKQYQAEIASGKVTERTKWARVRELSAIREVIKKKQDELILEEKLQAFFRKKLHILEREAAYKNIRIGALKDEISELRHAVDLEERRKAILEGEYALRRMGRLLESELLGDSREYLKMKKFSKDIAQGGLTAMLAILKASIERWKELDKAALEFRDATGLLVSQTREIDNAAREVNTQFAHIGVGIREAYNAAAALTKEFNVAGLVTKENIAAVAQLNANIGISVTDAAKFYGLFESTARASGLTSEKLMGAASALADMAGVSPQLIMQDVAKASDDTLKFLSKNPIQLIRAAVEARRLGTSLESISKSARGMLNYQDSITAELEASAMIGRSINFQQSRLLAYQGKIAESREEAFRQVKRAGDWTKMDVFQKEALARAAGMTVEEIEKQFNQEKMLAALQREKPALYKQYLDYQKKIKDNEAAAAKDLVGQGELFVKQQMRQSEMNKLTNSFKSMWTNISDSLLPIANSIMPSIVTGARAAAAGFRVVGKVISGFLSPLDAVFSQFRSGNSGMLDLEKTFARMHTFIEDKIVPVAEGFGTVLGNIYAFSTKISIGIALISRNATGLVNAYMPFVNLMNNAGVIIQTWMVSIGRAISGGAYLSGMFGRIFSPIARIAGFLFEIGGMVARIGGFVFRWVGLFAKVLGPIGVVINAIQVIMDFSGQLLSIWNSNQMNVGEKIIRSLLAIPVALYNALIKPFVNIFAYIVNKFSPGLGDSIVKSMESIGSAILDAIVWPFKMLWSLFDGTLNLGSKILDMLVWPFKMLWSAIKATLNFGGMLLEMLTQPFKDLIKYLDSSLNFGETILNGVKSIGSRLLDAIMWPFHSAYNLITNMFSSNGDLMTSIVNGIKSIGMGVLMALTWPFRTAIQVVSNIFGINGDVGSNIVEGVKSIGAAIINALTLPYRVAFKFVTGLFGGDGEFGKSIVEGMTSVGSSIVNVFKTIFSVVGTIMTAPARLISGIFSEIGGSIGKLADNISGEKILASIKRIVGASIDVFKTAFSALADIIILPFKLAGTVIKTMFGTILNAFIGGDEIISKIADVSQKISKVIVDGITSGAKIITEVIAFPFTSVIKIVEKVFGEAGEASKKIVAGMKAISLNVSGLVKSIFSSMVDALTASFKKISDLVANIFNSGGKIARTIADDITQIGKFVFRVFTTVMSTLTDVLTLPFKMILDSVQKIASFGATLVRDVTAQLSGSAQARVTTETASVVELRGMNELKESMDRLNSSIEKLGEQTISPVINIKDSNSEEVVKKLDELIGLMRSGGIGVNIDGIRVSQQLATRS